MKRVIQILLVASAVFIPLTATCQKPTENDVNAANNPLTPKITVNLHDQGGLKLYDLSPGSNAFLLRGLIPHKLGGTGQLFRFTMPMEVNSPNGTGGSVVGVGDLNIIDLFPFLLKKAKMEMAVGPQFTFPTASERLTGTGKYQMGVATLVIAPRKWGIGGTLITWQHSIGGDSSRNTQNSLQVQPLVLYNLPQAWYLRSTAIVNVDIEQGNYVLPLGIGAGKVWVLPSGTSINAFCEPQFSVAHNGAGQPEIQIFGGVNFQFPLRLKKQAP
jgi:hypothetical protein